MPDASIVVAQPADPKQLVLLFHGVGSSAADLAPVGEAIAQARPGAMVVSVDAPHPSTLGKGREWFSVVGVTEQNRPQRVAAAMPLFLECIARWQQVAGLGPEATVLVGFSQGAIMSLESTQVDGPAAAGCVIALAGRLAEPVRRAPAQVRWHLVHGQQDGVVPTRCSVEAAQALQAMGAQVTLDLLPGLGHGIDARTLRLVTAYLDEPRASAA
jgi:phospholipase/carboxylesterase